MPKNKGKAKGPPVPIGDLNIFGPLVAAKHQDGLLVLYRDRSYLDMDEGRRAQRILVLSKSMGVAWIKTERQAIIDRAKALGVIVRYEPELDKYKCENMIVSAKGGADEYLTKQALSALLDKTRNNMLGSSPTVTIASKLTQRIISQRVVVDGGTITVQELEGKPPEAIAAPAADPKKGKGKEATAVDSKLKVRLEPNVFPTAVLDRGLRRGRRRVLLQILKLGPSPMRFGAFSSAVEAGSHWCFNPGLLSLQPRAMGQAWFCDSTGYLFDGGHLCEVQGGRELGAVDTAPRLPTFKQGDFILIDLSIADGKLSIRFGTRLRPPDKPGAAPQSAVADPVPTAAPVLDRAGRQARRGDYYADLDGVSYFAETIVGECPGKEVYVGVQFTNSFDSVVLLLDEEGTVPNTSSEQDGMHELDPSLVPPALLLCAPRR
jgi:hypothetical protein